MTCASCSVPACTGSPCLGTPATNGNPRLVLPGAPGSGVGPLPRPSASLVEVFGPTVDLLRQLYTDFGLRPYRIFSVVVRWSGLEPGRGTPRVISELELLPTPRLIDTSGVQGVVRSGGLVERGSVRLDQISPRYTEDQVRALFFLEPLPATDQGWIEARIDARDGVTERRRFIVSGIPFRDADGFQWRANLLRQDEDRSRAGVPANVHR